MDILIEDGFCPINSHGRKAIIGLCENKFCKQKDRKCCYDCFQLHQMKDPCFNIKDIKIKEGLSETIDQAKKKYSELLNSYLIQCEIQQYILTQQLTEFISNWQYKQQNLLGIFEKHKKFMNNQWNKLTVEEYLRNDNNNSGIYKYLEKFDKKVSDIGKLKDYYLTTTVNQGKQNNQEKEFANQTHLQNFITNHIIIIKIQQCKFFQNYSMYSFLIFIANYFKNSSQKDDPYVSLCEIILKQGYELNTNNMHQQFEEIYDLILQHQLKDYQILYLQAYALYYSDNNQNTKDKQLNFINSSIEINNDYEKSQKLKKLIKQNFKQSKSHVIEGSVLVQMIETHNNQYYINQQDIIKQTQPKDYPRKTQNLRASDGKIKQTIFNKQYNSKTDTLYFQDQSLNKQNGQETIKSCHLLSKNMRKDENNIDVCLLIDNTVSMKNQLGLIKSALEQINQKAYQNLSWSLMSYEKEKNIEVTNLHQNFETIVQSLRQIQFKKDFLSPKNIEQGFLKALKLNWQSKVKVIIILTDAAYDQKQQFVSNQVEFIENSLKYLIEQKIYIIQVRFQEFEEQQQFNETDYLSQHRFPHFIKTYLVQDSQNEFVDLLIKMFEEITQESIIIKQQQSF